jgi:hypothetical protein
MDPQDKITARENSTLVFATVAASASLLVLAVVLQTPYGQGIPLSIRGIGFLFSLLGPLYRDVTVFTIDQIDYMDVQSPKKYPKHATLPRMIIVRYFLLLPVVAWLTINSRPFWFLLLNIAALGLAGGISHLELSWRKK